MSPLLVFLCFASLDALTARAIQLTPTGPQIASYVNGLAPSSGRTTITLAPGFYSGMQDMDLSGKSIRVDIIFDVGAVVDCGGVGHGWSFWSTSPTSVISLTNAHFRNCEARMKDKNSGGAVYLGNLKEVFIDDSVFENNTAINHGGAIYAEFYAQTILLKSLLQIANCSFVGNYVVAGLSLNFSDSYGGALTALRLSAVSIVETNFSSNFATTSSTTRFDGSQGGAVCFFGVSSALLRDCAFQDNKCHGTGLRNNSYSSTESLGLGGAIAWRPEDDYQILAIEQTIFSRNTADLGGSIYSSGGATSLSCVSILGCRAVYESSALFFEREYIEQSDSFTYLTMVDTEILSGVTERGSSTAAVRSYFYNQNDTAPTTNPPWATSFYVRIVRSTFQNNTGANENFFLTRRGTFVVEAGSLEMEDSMVVGNTEVGIGSAEVAGGIALVNALATVVGSLVASNTGNGLGCSGSTVNLSASSLFNHVNGGNFQCGPACLLYGVNLTYACQGCPNFEMFDACFVCGGNNSTCTPAAPNVGPTNAAACYAGSPFPTSAFMRSTNADTSSGGIFATTATVDSRVTTGVQTPIVVPLDSPLLLSSSGARDNENSVIWVGLAAAACCFVFFISAMAVYYRRSRASRRNYAVSDLEPIPPRGNSPVSVYESFPLTSNPQPKYTAERLIGKGQFGSVYSGRTLQGEVVALKELNVEGMSASDLAEMKREAVLLERCQHEFVVTFFGVVDRQDIGQRSECLNSSNGMFMVMALCEFGDLKSAILMNQSGNGIRYDPISILIMAEQAARGMAFLHSQNVIHRDIALRNLLVGGCVESKEDPKLSMTDGSPCQILISDFGLGRMLGSEYSAYYSLNAGQLPIRWTAPEAALAGRYGKESDVYAFGVTICELVNGCRLPFKSNQTQELVTVLVSEAASNRTAPPCFVIAEKPEPFVLPWSGLPIFPEIWNIALECCATDPRARPTFRSIVDFLSKQTAQ